MIKKSFEARAKINLGLEILFKRPDGFHEIKSIMQSICLSDTLEIELLEGSGIELETLGTEDIKTEDNLVFGAAELFLRECGKKFALKMRLIKRIPQMAGLGGGSSDAACTLKALNELSNFPLSDKELFSLASKLGSDVTFFLSEGTALVSGRGEIIESLGTLPRFFLLIAMPRFRSSTKELYSRFNKEKVSDTIEIGALVKLLDKQKYEEFFLSLKNRFEDLLTAGDAAEVLRLKEMFLKTGALGASLSGSGSAVFGVYPNEDCLNSAFEKLSGEISELYKTAFYTNFI
ncbi:MAG: 4-(cytidine 5'-diphospho)-2-C-methyl-D-erythritol kinase [Candidatus Scatomorpha sp.]|jgi:4-diphosphocytidyl-2-C-methyl-D-erythritol kinase